jgi:hypothetical protein
MLGPRELFRHPVPAFSVANAMVDFCLVPGKGTNFSARVAWAAPHSIAYIELRLG